MRNAKVLVVICLVAAGLVLSMCLGGSRLKTAWWPRPLMAATSCFPVERQVSQQAGGNTSSLNQLQMAQARLQVLSGLIQREVLYQRAEREKVLPTDAQIEGAIATQKQNSGMTAEDFDKSLKAQNMSMETLRDEAKKDLAIAALQDKYNGKINISDREVEEYYSANRQLFKNERGVALAMIVVDPLTTATPGSPTTQERSRREDQDRQHLSALQGKADFATVARAKSEVNSLRAGGDVGFATEEDLRNNNFPPDLIAQFFGPMQVGDYTQPVRFGSSGKWYIFKLAEKRLATENLTLEARVFARRSRRD